MNPLIIIGIFIGIIIIYIITQLNNNKYYFNKKDVALLLLAVALGFYIGGQIILFLTTITIFSIIYFTNIIDFNKIPYITRIENKIKEKFGDADKDEDDNESEESEVSDDSDDEEHDVNISVENNKIAEREYQKKEIVKQKTDLDDIDTEKTEEFVIDEEI
jgi:hypothetical protein